jgi:hypothetical protein
LLLLVLLLFHLLQVLHEVLVAVPGSSTGLSCSSLITYLHA